MGMRGMKSVASLLLVASAAPAIAAGTYNPQAAFAPLSLPGPVNAYRSGSGLPASRASRVRK